MTGKSLLEKCRREMRELLVVGERCETIRTSLLPRAIRPTQDKVQVTPEKHFEEAISVALDLENTINNRMALMIKDQQEAQALIDKLTDSRERCVLTLYYLTYYSDGRTKSLNTWESVAGTMGYSERHIMRIHNDAIKKIK